MGHILAHTSEDVHLHIAIEPVIHHRYFQDIVPFPHLHHASGQAVVVPDHHMVNSRHLSLHVSIDYVSLDPCPHRMIEIQRCLEPERFLRSDPIHHNGAEHLGYCIMGSGIECHRPEVMDPRVRCPGCRVERIMRNEIRADLLPGGVLIHRGSLLKFHIAHGGELVPGLRCNGKGIGFPFLQIEDIQRIPVWFR